MKFLCLAYGAEKDWQTLSKVEQDALLAQDEVLRQRGDLVAAVREPIVTLRAWDGRPHTTEGSYSKSQIPLAGCGIIEADNISEVVQLLADTPCARAKGVVEIHPISAINFEARETVVPEHALPDSKGG